MKIQEIKQQLGIEKVLSHYGLQADKNNRLCCPFHKDKTPSLQVYPKTNSYCCFSSNCDAGTGDVIQFIQLKEKCSKHEAIVKAKVLLGKSEERKGVREVKVESSKPKVESQPQNYTELFTRLKNSISKSSNAKRYLKDRGLEKLIGSPSYGVGYNASVWDRHKYCVIFPLRNKSGEIVNLYGRSVIADNKNKHYYLPNRQGLYPTYPSREVRQLIITESIIDAATLLSIPEITEQYEVLALYGTNGLTTEHVQALQQVEKLEEIILFFDGDKAGVKAVEKQGEYLKELFEQVSITKVNTPEGEDVNSLLVKYDKDCISQLLEERINFSLSTESELLPVEALDSTELVAPTSKQGVPVDNNENGQERKGFYAAGLDAHNTEYITYQTGNLLFTMLGGINLNQLDRLRVTVKISRMPQLSPLHSLRHNIDLYNDDQVDRLTRKTAEKLDTSTKEVSSALAHLIEALENYRLAQLETKKEKKPKKRELTAEQTQRALKYLKAPNLMSRTSEGIAKSGLVGEKNNALLMYLSFTSRLREKPLHVVSLGASGTGKTYLQEKVSELIPEHAKLEITTLSENAFYYFGKQELAHKLILIEDLDGAESVLYPLRELQSKRRISKTVPLQDSKGNLRTITLEVEGPVAVAGTTTKERIYEDNANRSLLLYLDNSKEHQESIMDYQRAVSAGQINSELENKTKEQFMDMQCVLKNIAVRNPYAQALKIPSHVFKPLRSNAHYLDFIEVVTFYHQYQRRVASDKNTGEQYIETTLEDIAWANYLLKDVLLAKSDELSQALRQFFEGIKYYLSSKPKSEITKGHCVSFYAREIRDKLRLNPMTVNRYLRELEHRGYIKRAGGNRKTGFEYEVVNYQEYSELKEGIEVLDTILENLKKKQKNKSNTSVTMGDVILNGSESLVN